MMKLMSIMVVLFSHYDSAQMNAVIQPNSVISAAPGETVTLHCFRMEEGNTDPIVWYKQAVGHEPRVMVTIHKLAQNPVFKDEFNSPRFAVKTLKRSSNLTIAKVDASDEAVYYCGLKEIIILFAKGTFLSVKGKPNLSVSVFQSSVLDSVPAGASVTLQCSVLSESRAAELQVLWFRAAPPQSHPQIIYTHHNSSHQCESGSSTHTCVYNFSKNILSLNDTGTYYCAVAACGKIIFGNGTRVQLEKSVDVAVFCFAVALGVCVVVISVQTFLLLKWKSNEQCIKRQTLKRPEQTNTQVHDFVEVNYAALHFNEKKNKSGRKNRGRSQDTVYSEVRSLTTT
ncbi:uncharacterized protein Hap1MRO34_012578 [Clarias gariepinus]